MLIKIPDPKVNQRLLIVNGIKWPFWKEDYLSIALSVTKGLLIFVVYVCNLTVVPA